MADLFKILLAEKLGHCDSLYESVIGKKLGGYSWQSDYETTPYLYRAMPNMSHYYNREIMEEVVGGSVGWNQNLKELSSSNWANEGGVTSSFSDGVATITNSSPTNRGIYTLTSFVSGHKYFISAELSTVEAKMYIVGRSSIGVYVEKDLPANSGFVKLEKICIATSTTDTNCYIYGTGGEYTNLKAKNAMCIDLTLALGSTIADYVYSLEQATAGSGVAWLKEHFPKMFQYNPYDAGSIQSVSGLVSHDTVGFNQWDEEWELGMIDTDGVPYDNPTTIRTKNFTRVLPSVGYYCNKLGIGGVRSLYYYDIDKNFISLVNDGYLGSKYFITPPNCAYIKFRTYEAYGTTYKNDICINLSDASRNGQYEPYRKSSYPLDSTLTLRGIPKLDNGKLYYDGDVYEPDGTVTRVFSDEYVIQASDIYQVDDTYENVIYARMPIKTGWMNSNSKQAINSKFGVGEAVYPFDDANAIGKMARNAWTNNYFFGFAKGTTLEQMKNALAGTTMVAELATPTTETAQPFTKTQLCDSGGTEEFVTSGIVSVGHKSKYAEK